jgi:hypothetical protein
MCEFLFALSFFLVVLVVLLLLLRLTIARNVNAATRS